MIEPYPLVSFDDWYASIVDTVASISVTFGVNAFLGLIRQTFLEVLASIYGNFEFKSEVMVQWTVIYEYGHIHNISTTASYLPSARIILLNPRTLLQ